VALVSLHFDGTGTTDVDFVDYHWRLGATMPMKNPPHPGLSVRIDCLEPLGLTVTKAAKVLGVTRQALNNLVNGKAGISPEMAVRLSKAFGGSAEVWLGMQLDYDLAQVRKREGGIRVQRVRAAPQPA
jgi:antitoxin HigA-1